MLPDEQQQKVIQKNPKPKKSANQRSTLPARPRELDPAKIQLDHGSFCTGSDDPVGQVDFAQIGPLVSGVALTTFAEALPFLQADKLLTNRGLALLILNPPADLPTNLQWAHCPLCC